MAQKRKAKEAFGGQLSAFAAARKAKTPQAPEEAIEERLAAAIGAVPYDEDHDVDDIEADQTHPAKASIKLSDLGRSNVLEIETGHEITLRADQSITLVGEFDLQILSGVVSVYGAMLHPASGVRRVYSLSSSALPPITAKKSDTRMRVSSVQAGIQVLEKYSPLFRNLGSGSHINSYTLLRTTADDTLQRNISALEIDENTRKVLSRINAQLEAGQSSRIMTVGPKSSGKSTLNRILCNMITTRPGGGKCFYLDLDPGQPEFGPPGQVSLVEVNAPLLGPSYTRMALSDSPKHRLMCSHSIAATSFKDDPGLYFNCVVNLCEHLPKGSPVVINTCGWINGLGASVLLGLLPHFKVTEVVRIGAVDAAFEEGLRSTSDIHQIPRRQVRATSTRTPAELRAMQTMAYFHHKQIPGGESVWIDQAISRDRPWMVSYERGQPGIAAVLPYGQAPSPDFLAEALDGMIVAVVLPDLINLEAVKRTENEDLPYIVDPASCSSPPLHPSESKFIGLALVRAIDQTEKRIHLVTTIPDHSIAVLLDRQIVLVSGAFDCPEWAYLEDLHAFELNGEYESDIVDERPWVSKREAHVGVEGAVWRLRHPPMRDAVK